MRSKENGEANKILLNDQPVHEWYRFVLSYPPHLVRDYLQRFRITNKQLALDPFCGTGTTLVECKKLGVPSVGIEANPMAYLACKVKTAWGANPDGIRKTAKKIADNAIDQFRAEGFEDDPLPGNLAHLSSCRTLPAELAKLILTDSISPLPLHKTLVLRDCLDRFPARDKAHLQLALAKAIVFSISNLHFGPEVGVGKKQVDCAVIAPWLSEVARIVDDLLPRQRCFAQYRGRFTPQNTINKRL